MEPNRALQATMTAHLSAFDGVARPRVIGGGGWPQRCQAARNATTSDHRVMRRAERARHAALRPGLISC
jgi:hypothetical protein